MDARNVPVKTGVTGGFQINAFNAASGAAIYSLSTDYIQPSHNWILPYQPVLATSALGTRLYYPGAGGTIYYVDNVDSAGHGAPVQQAFYGLNSYNADKAGFNSTVFINTPITADSSGNVFFGFRVSGTAPAPLNTTQSGFARIAPEKGLQVLVEAYRSLRARGELAGARLEAAGYLAPEHKDYLSRIEQQMKDAGLAAEFHYRGVLDRHDKIDFLRQLDVLSVPATYDEPKGIFLLEAMACGVPVVQPRRGAFPEIIERTGGGLLVEPDDAESLAEGILTIRQDPALAARLGKSGFENVREHYNVARMATSALDVYAGLAL